MLTVEAVTGVARAILRPDLYDDNNESTGVDEVDLARAQEYALLAALLTRAPDAAFLQRLATLRGDPTPLGVAHSVSPTRPAVPTLPKSSANFSICSSASAAAS